MAATQKRHIIKCHGDSLEDLYFMEQDRNLIKEMRAKARKESDDKYRADHREHCFRCGTKSLVTMNYREVGVDVCVNEECGCVHLDPGELEDLAKGEAKSLLRCIQKTLFGLP